MPATVSDILGKGFVYEQTAELQRLPAATGTILAGIGSANWGPVGLPVFIQNGLQGFEKAFGGVIDATESKDSSYLMMAYHFLSSSRGWFTRTAEGATKAALEWFIPDAAPQLLGSKVVKNKDFLLYDSTDGIIKENNKMTIRAEVDDAGTPMQIDIDILLDASKKALLLTESQSLSGSAIKPSYTRNTILKIQDGNDVLTNEYNYTTVTGDDFLTLKSDVENEKYANFSIAWIRSALKYLLKTTDSSAIPASIFKFANFQNRVNDGKLHGPLKLTEVKAIAKEAKAVLTYRAKEIIEVAYDTTSASSTDLSSFNGKYILLKTGSYTNANFTGLTADVSPVQNSIYLVSVTGSSVTLTLVSLPTSGIYIVKSDTTTGPTLVGDDSKFEMTNAGVISLPVALTVGQKFLVEGFQNQKRDIVNYSAASTYTAYANSPKIIVGASYIDRTGTNDQILKFDGSAYTNTAAGSTNYYVKGEGNYFKLNPTQWDNGIALADGDKLVEQDLGLILEWDTTTTSFLIVTDYKTLNPYIDDAGGLAANIYYKYKNSTSQFIPVVVSIGEYGLAAAGFGGALASDTSVKAFTIAKQFAGSSPTEAEGDVWISENTGLLVYKTSTGYETRYNNYDTTNGNYVAFESSDRGSKAFVRVIESVANLFALGDVSKAYGLNTPITTIIDNINYQASRAYQDYLTANALPSNINPNAIPAELDRLVVATIDASNVLMLTTVQAGSNIKLRLNKLSGANFGDISNKNPYALLGLPNVGNVTQYPTGFVEVVGKDQELVGSFEAFYSGKDGNTIRFINSLGQDGTTLRVFFRGSLIAVFTNYSYNPGDANYIGTLIANDPNTREVIVMNNLVPNKTFPYGTFTFSGGSSGGFAADDIYAAEVTKYQNIDLYDIDVLCVSGISSNTVISKVKEVCEKRQDCLGIIDPPQSLSVAGVLNWSNGLGDGNDLTTDDSVKLDSYYTATYYPWVNIPIQKNGTTIYQWHAPSVRVAGSIAKNDNAQGHKVGAPAGIRTTFTDVAALEVYLEDDDKTRLYADVYDANINPIVFTTVDGYFIDGQKTTWRRKDALRRINVARSGMYIKKRVAEAAKLYFWNPTDPAAWSDYRVLLQAILRQLVAWRAAEENYLITTDASVNTEEVVNNNGMVGVIDWTPTKVVERLKTISNIKESTSGVTTQVV